jgi:hypothetical protein
MLAGRRRGLIVYRLVTVCLAQERHGVDSLILPILSTKCWAWNQILPSDIALVGCASAPSWYKEG